MPCPAQIAPPDEGCDSAAAAQHARKLFTLMFHDEIQNRLEMKADSYKTAKFKPVPLDLESLLATAPGTVSDVAASASGEPMLVSQRVLSPSDSARLFLEAVQQFYSHPRRVTVGACEVWCGVAN